MSASGILEQTEKMEEESVKQEIERINRIFAMQQKHRHIVAKSSVGERIQKLKKLKQWVESNTEKIHKALYSDFKKSVPETDLTEIFVVTTELNHAISHLKRWMKPKQVSPTVPFLTTKAEIRYEPKGNCLIIAPWNFPFNLTIGPLISCIAAGNTAMVKPSEFTPATSRLMKEMLLEVFAEEEVAVFEGAVEISQALLAKPFHHIFFTGSPQVGKIVMKAAAEHLASVTLELGGKSPVIVDETADLEDAAKKIAWGKGVNNGQICIAPDYLLVHESKKDALLDKIKQNLNNFYGDSKEEKENSSDYARIISTRHHSRLKKMLEDTVNQGATVYAGGNSNAEDNYLEPTVLVDIPEDAPVLHEEIFGPILPVKTYKNLDEVIEYVNAKEKPLALYIFSNSKKNQELVISSTSAGGTCVNDVLTQFLHPNIPFGGINNSGIGNSHGEYGFKAFSHERSVLHHHAMSPLKLLMPPYTDQVKGMIKMLLRFF
ncbi:MAG: aldehyde dehydrogenase family protein [Spirochaetota bacterium]